MIDKIVGSIAEALEGIADGAVVLVGGFGPVGTPDDLLEGLIAQGARDLTVVSNNGGVGDGGLTKLLAAGRVRRLVCSFPKGWGSTSGAVFEELYKAGKIELEVVPQGTLAERMRAAGAGVPAFFTATGVGTVIAEGKEVREFDGRTYVMEHALPGDVALVSAWQADRWGNLVYRSSGRNFNPVVAMAAKCTVVQAHQIVGLGDLSPETIVTPGIFVDRVVQVRMGEDS